MKTYHTNYRLKQDLPTGQVKGQEVRYSVNKDDNSGFLFFFCKWDSYFKKWNSLDLDFKGISFTLEQVENDVFFEPIGKEHRLIVPFPTIKGIKEFYHLLGENRLVASVDQVRCINPIFYSDEFYKDVYNLLKKRYNEYYKIN